MISAGRMHLYLPLLHHRDDFHRPDSSLPCSFSPQGLFLPPRCISILLFCSTGIISAGRMHLYLALLLHKDYFHRSNASLACFFLPQGSFPPVKCISILLFCSTKIISAGRMHLYLALFFHRDDFAPVRCVPSLRTSLSGHSVNFRKTPESMFFNLSYATLDALRKQSFLRLSAAMSRIQPIA